MLGFAVSGALHKVGGIVVRILAVELPQTFSASPDINRLVVETRLLLIAAVVMFERSQNEKMGLEWIQQATVQFLMSLPSSSSKGSGRRFML